MKRQLLLLATVLLGFTSANAQCTPTSSCTPDPQTGFCATPAVGSNLPNGTVGTPYTTDIQISVGSTAGGGAVTITDVTINSIALPTGLSYTTSPASGVIPGGTDACIQISGTPTSAEVDFSVDISITANTSFGPIPYTLSYLLTIDGGTASLSEVNNVELSLYPNPVEDKLNISVKEPTSFKITNVLGTVVLEDKVTSTKTVNVSGLKNGVYFVTNMTTGRSIKFVKK